MPCEWNAFAEYFYGKEAVSRQALWTANGYRKVETAAMKEFDYAVLHHYNMNPHHWNHWVMKEDTGAVYALEMPIKYVAEMICDWKGAGKAQGNVGEDGRPEVVVWYNANKDKIMLHENTRKLVEQLLHNEK
jgi:hypothetical protein